jgi:hypothetical protein
MSKKCAVISVWGNSHLVDTVKCTHNCPKIETKEKYVTCYGCEHYQLGYHGKKKKR